MTRARLLIAAAALAGVLAVASLARAVRTGAGPLARPVAAPTDPPASQPTAASTAGTPAVAPPPSTPAAVRAALAALDRARAAAYAHPDTGDPDTWAARDCPCHAADAARLRALARAGQSLRGAAARIDSVTAVRAGPGAVTAVVTDRLAPYTAVDRYGRTVARWAGTGPRRWRIRLVRAAGRWLLGSIARAP